VQPLVHHRLLSSLTIKALAHAAEDLECLMRITSSSIPNDDDPTAASKEQLESLLLFTILAIERNWIYPLGVTEFDPAELGYVKHYFLRIIDLIVRLDGFHWRPTFPSIPHPPTLADLSERLPILRLRMLASMHSGGFCTTPSSCALLRVRPRSSPTSMNTSSTLRLTERSIRR
jgi:hypothetical protein